jgi:hypothetical protein
MRQVMESIEAWCEAVDLPCREASPGVLAVSLDDRSPALQVEVPVGGSPLQVHDLVAFDTELATDRLAEVVEGVVLGRSSLVDARPTADGAGAQIVVVVHADGLSQHTFLEALFEVQKIRLLLQREVRAAAAADRTFAALETLAGQSWAGTPTSA